MVIRFQSIFLVFFLSFKLMATRMELLEDAIVDGGAPTVPYLLEAAELLDNPFNQVLAREAIIMVYLDVDHGEASDMDALFVAAQLPNNDNNLAIVMRLIEAMPPADEEDDSASELDWSGDELSSDDEVDIVSSSAAAA